MKKSPSEKPHLIDGNGEPIVVVDKESSYPTSFFPKKMSDAGVKPLTAQPLEKNLKFWARYKYKRNPHMNHVVTMFFKNGTCSEYFITTNADRFTKGGKTYVLNSEDARKDLALNQNHYFFNEDYSMPINKEVIVKGDTSFLSVTPSTLTSYIKMSVVQELVGGNEISKYLKMLVLISVVGTISAVVSTALLLNQLRMASGK